MLTCKIIRSWQASVSTCAMIGLFQAWLYFPYKQHETDGQNRYLPPGNIDFSLFIDNDSRVFFFSSTHEVFFMKDWLTTYLKLFVNVYCRTIKSSEICYIRQDDNSTFAARSKHHIADQMCAQQFKVATVFLYYLKWYRSVEKSPYCELS